MRGDLGATAGFIAGSIVHDFRGDADIELWARRGGELGGVLGLAALLWDT